MKFLSLTIFLFFSADAFAQKEQNILQAKDGAFIFLSESAVGTNFKAAAYDYVTVSTNINGKWQELQKVAGAKNEKEFSAIVGNDALSEIKIQRKLNTASETWSFIQNNAIIKNYGLYAFSKNFMQALGVLYVHNFDTKKYTGKTVSYKLEYYKSGKLIDQKESSIVLQDKLTLAKPQLIAKNEKDSLIQVKWLFKKTGDEPVVYGNVYKSDAKGNMQLVSKLLALIPNNGKDSIIFNFSERVTPGQLFSYSLIPANYADFEGTASDTVSLFSINFEKINQVTNLKAKDTVGGIYLSFTPPPSSPVITGIIVERSRYDKTGYAAIDTIPPAATNYLDQKLLPNVSYYYHLRTISIRQLPLPSTAWAGATHLNKKEPDPLPPVSVKTIPTPKGVVIKWQPQPQADIGGFRVYRANNPKDNLTAISLIVQENEFLDTTALDNRRQYTYAVSSINYSEAESALSEFAFASPVNNIILPSIPVGLNAAAENGRVILNWKNMQTGDAFIKGYKIYRKELSATEKLIDKIWEPKELLKNGYRLVQNNIIDAATYTDEFSNAVEKYAYYITAVDDKNTEGNAAGGITVTIPKPNLMPPGNFSVRKVSTGIAVSWDKSRQANITGYVIYRREAENSKSTVLVKIEKSNEEYIDKGVLKNKTYYYSVAATAGNNYGVPSLEKGVFNN
jgi:fibronectin type 3 domain-containing protein